jgi:hypothetical protein
MIDFSFSLAKAGYLALLVHQLKLAAIYKTLLFARYLIF